MRSAAEAILITLRSVMMLMASGTISGCTALRPAASAAECSPPSYTPLVPFAPSRALALAGTYDLTIVADSGPRAGHTARGSISLVANDTLHRYYIKALGPGWRRRGDRPLMGWGSFRGDVGLMTAGTPIDSHNPEGPGIVVGLDSLEGGLRFMLGYGPMLDGGSNEFVVTTSDDDRFAGRWQSSLGPTTYRATGYFCARRRT